MNKRKLVGGALLAALMLMGAGCGNDEVNDDFFERYGAKDEPESSQTIDLGAEETMSSQESPEEMGSETEGSDIMDVVTPVQPGYSVK